MVFTNKDGLSTTQENRVEIQPGKHSMERNGGKESSKGKVTRDTGKEFEKKRHQRGAAQLEGSWKEEFRIEIVVIA